MMNNVLKRVERRQHRNGKPRRFLWLAAAVLLFATSVTTFVLLSRNPQVELPAREDTSGLLINRPAEDLISVTVHRRGEEPWTLVRTESGEWVSSEQSEGDAWTVEGQLGTMLEEAMTQLLYTDILTDNPSDWQEDRDEFGLADPAVSVTGHYSDGTEITVYLGDQTGLEEGWYYLSAEGVSPEDDGRLYAVSAGIAEDLDVEFSLLHPVPKPEILASLLDRITVLDWKGETAVEWMLQGKITDRDAADNWAVTVPFFYPADEEAVQNLKKSAENLRLGVYTAPATEENLALYGLSKPVCTLVFHMAAGSTGTVSEAGVYDVADHEEKNVTLWIGDARDELADYVRFGDEIFTVSHFTLSVFTEPEAMDYVARYPVLIPIDSLESVTVETFETSESGNTDKSMVLKYTLGEKEQSEEDGEESTVRSCILNGNEISYEAFEAAYDRLLTVTFSGVLPEGAEWEEPYKKYTFRTLNGGTHTVELCSWDGMHDAVTVDGATLFYLIRGGMTLLPQEEPGQSR